MAKFILFIKYYRCLYYNPQSLYIQSRLNLFTFFYTSSQTNIASYHIMFFVMITIQIIFLKREHLEKRILMKRIQVCPFVLMLRRCWMEYFMVFVLFDVMWQLVQQMLTNFQYSINLNSLLYDINLKTMMTTGPNYDIKRIIGSGCFGYVFQAEDRKTHKKVALKRIQKVGNQLSRQYEILFMIKQCENVVHIQDFFYSKNDQGKLIQNIVFQYVDDNLQSLIEKSLKSKQIIEEPIVKKYIYQLLNGLKNIHEKNIAHRDLKPQNVLLSKDNVIKICDFGSSKIIDPNGKNTPYIVSRYYRAPELILCLTKYSTAIDIWAAGCILAELFTLTPLFKGKTEGDQLFAIFRVLGSLSPEETSDYRQRVPFDPSLFDSFGSFKRTNLKEYFKCIKDRNNFLDLLLRMLAYLPQKRITAKQALNHPFFKHTECPQNDNS